MQTQFILHLLETAGMNVCIEDTYNFVQTQVATAYASSSSTLSLSQPFSSGTFTCDTSDPATVINDTLQDLLRIGSRLSLPHVRSFITIVS